MLSEQKYWGKIKKREVKERYAPIQQTCLLLGNQRQTLISTKSQPQ